jgi:hypothetical protein
MAEVLMWGSFPSPYRGSAGSLNVLVFGLARG